MKQINEIIIHCADSKDSMDIGVKEITQWHKARGFNDIGYHYVIRKDGTMEKGRRDDVQGAHCRGHNQNSLGICWVGGFGGVDDRTEEQKIVMNFLIARLQIEHPEATVHGHNEFSTKTCPNFDVSSEF